MQVASYRDYLGMLGAVPGARAAGMWRNLQWYRAHWPTGSRIVVWTASVHAHRQRVQPADPVPLGEQLRQSLGRAVASIGFTALEGAHGRAGAIQELPAAIDGSLEDLALGGRSGSLGVLDHTALCAAGRRPARVFDYGQWLELDWSAHFDAVVVVREERPVAKAAN